MTEPLHPSQLPDDWKDQLDRAYAAFDAEDLERRMHEIKNILRNRGTGQYMRRRNTPESMRNAPSPYKSRVYHPAPLHNLIRLDGKGLPPDVYDRLYEFLDRRPSASKWNRETVQSILEAHGRPEAAITVFRPVPFIVNQLLPGDAVLLSPSYAGTLANGRPRWRVITGTVPAQELITRSDKDLMRWNWNGIKPLPNGGVAASRPEPRGRRII